MSSESEGQPLPETPFERHAREFREREIRSGSMLGLVRITPEERSRVMREDQARRVSAEAAAKAEAAKAPPPPWYREGMSPFEAHAAEFRHARETREAAGRLPAIDARVTLADACSKRVDLSSAGRTK